MKRNTRGKKNKFKIDKYLIRRILAILLVILLILFIKSIISYFFNKNNTPELSILLNNEIIETEKDVIIDEDQNIYFSKEDIQNIFDETIYYNEGDKELITTYNKHVALLTIGENYMVVNDSNIELSGTLQEINNIIYIPIKDLSIVYDLEIEYSTSSNTIIMDSTYNEKVEGTVSKRVKLKNKKGIFKKTLEKLEAGTKVVIIGEDGKYSKVRTTDGSIGYIKTKRLINIETIRENMEDEVYELNVYSEYSNITGIYDKVSIEENKLNVVIPTFFYLDKNCKVLDKTTSSTASYANYMNWVEENELSVLPTFSNNESVSETLLSFSQRNQVINELYTYIVQYQFKGINVNFESIDDVNSFYRFLIEITPRFKESGLIVAVTMNDSLDKTKIEKITNYVIEK